MTDRATIFAMTLGMALQLASLGLAVSGFHHMNGLYIPATCAIAGTVLFWWPMIVTTSK